MIATTTAAAEARILEDGGAVVVMLIALAAAAVVLDRCGIFSTTGTGRRRGGGGSEVGKQVGRQHLGQKLCEEARYDGYAAAYYGAVGLGEAQDQLGRDRVGRCRL